MATTHHTTATTHGTTLHTTHGAGAHHEHGTMDSSAQQRTFEGFVRFMTWSAVLTILVLIFLALTNA